MKKLTSIFLITLLLSCNNFHQNKIDCSGYTEQKTLKSILLELEERDIDLYEEYGIENAKSKLFDFFHNVVDFKWTVINELNEDIKKCDCSTTINFSLDEDLKIFIRENKDKFQDYNYEVLLSGNSKLDIEYTIQGTVDKNKNDSEILVTTYGNEEIFIYALSYLLIMEEYEKYDPRYNQDTREKLTNLPNLQTFFSKWEKEHLSQNSTFAYLTEKECSENDNKRIALYESGKPVMYGDFIRYLELDYNGDNFNDYLITYNLETCIGSISSMTDFFFIVSDKKGNYTYDDKLTSSVKANFLKFAKENKGLKSLYSFDNKNHLIADGLIFKTVIENVFYGKYFITIDEPTCCSTITGNFYLDMNKNKFFLSDPIKG